MEIKNEKFSLDIYGFSGTAENKDYTATAFKLMDKMWQTLRSNNLKNKGQNIIVYDENENVFAGVELNEVIVDYHGLERKSITLSSYAYFKHVGPYDLIKQAGQKMKGELKEKGIETCLPYIEIYGHWNKDESKLETELLMCVK